MCVLLDDHGRVQLGMEMLFTGEKVVLRLDDVPTLLILFLVVEIVQQRLIDVEQRLDGRPLVLADHVLVVMAYDFRPELIGIWHVGQWQFTVRDRMAVAMRVRFVAERKGEIDRTVGSGGPARVSVELGTYGRGQCLLFPSDGSAVGRTLALDRFEEVAAGRFSLATLAFRLSAESLAASFAFRLEVARFLSVGQPYHGG